MIRLDEIMDILSYSAVYTINGEDYYQDQMTEIFKNSERWMVTFITQYDDYNINVMLEKIYYD